MSSRKKNTYIVQGDAVVVDISTPKHPNAQTVIDLIDLPLIENSSRRWIAVDTGRGPYVMRNRSYGHGMERLHRIIVGTKMQVDHQDGDHFNNRRKNLRPATQMENSRNMRSREGTSKFKGVSWDKINNRWKAQISVNWKTLNLGRYLKEDEAALAYDEAAKKLFGKFARLNLEVI